MTMTFGDENTFVPQDRGNYADYVEMIATMARPVIGRISDIFMFADLSDPLTREYVTLCAELGGDQLSAPCSHYNVARQSLLVQHEIICDVLAGCGYAGQDALPEGTAESDEDPADAADEQDEEEPGNGGGDAPPARVQRALAPIPRDAPIPIKRMDLAKKRGEAVWDIPMTVAQCQARLTEIETMVADLDKKISQAQMKGDFYDVTPLWLELLTPMADRKLSSFEHLLPSFMQRAAMHCALSLNKQMMGHIEAIAGQHVQACFGGAQPEVEPAAGRRPHMLLGRNRNRQNAVEG